MQIGLGKKDNKEFLYELEALKKHFVALGGSGSGKTVLCKVIIQEASKQGIPCILIDNQGDLASGLKADIYTPASTKANPVKINPLKIPKGLSEEDAVVVIDSISKGICNLLNINPTSSKGMEVHAELYKFILDAYHNNKKPTLEDLKETSIGKKIGQLTIGSKGLLFSLGDELDIKKLMEPGKVSVFYLNTLHNQEDKMFFISMLTSTLYQWMLKNPKTKLQSLYYIDEIAEYLPAGALKPITKPILTLLYKQARKYGLGCIMSTQNPGDIDYRAFSQFGTWALGRLTTQQGRNKIKESVRSLPGTVIPELPKLKPGEFFIFAPDLYNSVQKIQGNMIKEHKTITLDDEKPIQRKIYKPSSDFMHFPLNFGEDTVTKKHKSLFSKASSSTLTLRPIYRAIISTKSPILRRDLELELYFDAMSGDILSFPRGHIVVEWESGRDLKNLKSYVESPELSKDSITGKKLAPKLTEKDITKLIKPATISSSEIIYYPIYELKFGKGVTKVIKVSGVTGKRI